MSDSDVDILLNAREGIADPKRWTAGHVKDDQGRRCALGHIVRAIDEEKARQGTTMRLFEELAKLCVNHYGPSFAVSAVNDIKGQQAILSIFDELIELKKNGEL